MWNFITYANFVHINLSAINFVTSSRLLRIITTKKSVLSLSESGDMSLNSYKEEIVFEYEVKTKNPIK